MAFLNRYSLSPTWLRFLVAYYGVIQSAHLVALARALIILRTSGSLDYPALPPEGGWSIQAQEFLVGMGIADFLNILLSMYFVILFFKARTGWTYMGILSLSASTFSAIVFAYGTLRSGAWVSNPVAYPSLVLLFLPVEFLLIVLMFSVFRGKTQDRGVGG